MRNNMAKKKDNYSCLGTLGGLFFILWLIQALFDWLNEATNGVLGKIAAGAKDLIEKVSNKMENASDSGSNSSSNGQASEVWTGIMAFFDQIGKVFGVTGRFVLFSIVVFILLAFLFRKKSA
ncbi:MAG: hypothetical protein KDC44_14865 [Phaeodactylibacter sp.]|nr:hypothetical protein [Phaeodactylibacter sp.]